LIGTPSSKTSTPLKPAPRTDRSLCTPKPPRERTSTPVTERSSSS
jgi:hypothetical protein